MQSEIVTFLNDLWIRPHLTRNIYRQVQMVHASINSSYENFQFFYSFAFGIIRIHLCEWADIDKVIFICGFSILNTNWLWDHFRLSFEMFFFGLKSSAYLSAIKVMRLRLMWQRQTNNDPCGHYLALSISVRFVVFYFTIPPNHIMAVFDRKI